MRRKLVALTVAAAVLAAACTGGGGNDNGSGTGTTSDLGGEPGDCVTVDMAVSSEKIALMTELAKEFNGDENSTVDGTCIFVRPYSKASGGAATLLAQGWPDPETNGPQPVIWSPAASGWGAIVNQRLADQGKPAMAPPSKPFMLTPLVIAMPEPMAQALGYPGTPIGFADIVDLANDPEGWARYGHPEWGPFRLGKTNPNYSTSGLNFTVGEYYAATGKTSGLTSEDLDRPDVDQFVRDVEQAVVHYGDITMTFLNNWFRADAKGTALTYASAVAIEEKSIIDYNKGNPDGELAPGEVPRVPKVPLVAIYPEEGTLFSDNPLIILDAPWVTAEQKAAAEKFRDFVLLPENQAKVLEFGFRPGNPSVPLASPISPEFGVDPAEPQAVVEVPDPPVLVKVLDKWAEQRKAARVLLVIDVSGSMSDFASAGSTDTKLDLAKRAAISSLSQFKDEDSVGLRIFSTGLPGTPDEAPWLDLIPVEPIGPNRELLASRIDSLVPVQGTPLYDVTASSYAAMVDAYDPTQINAIVLLTDGYNDDGDESDDAAQLDRLVGQLDGAAEGGSTKPVRIFPIAYGEDADLATLRQIAEASNAAVYDASNPASIEQVFAAVVSNF
jgi:Ca-activated chloride channel family protein